MRLNYLFPNKSRWVGLGLILLHVPIQIIWKAHKADLGMHHLSPDDTLFTDQHLFYITSAILVLTGLFLIAFSKEKIEDEQISQLRLNSLRWAIYFNYFVLILSLIFTNGINFIDMLRLDIWLPLLFFILHFRWVIWRLNRSVTP